MNNRLLTLTLVGSWLTFACGSAAILYFEQFDPEQLPWVVALAWIVTIIAPGCLALYLMNKRGERFERISRFEGPARYLAIVSLGPISLSEEVRIQRRLVSS